MSEARELDLPIPPEAARQRADRFVADRSGLSRSFVQRLISEGHLTMNGLIVRASATLVPGETLHLVIPPVSETTLLAEDIPLTVVYEDEDIVVVNKPAGLLSVPGRLPQHHDSALLRLKALST